MHAQRVDTEELAALGYTVVRSFLTPEECARARAAIDSAFGAEPVEAVPPERLLEGFPSQTHSSGFMHSVCHPNPAMVCLVDAVPKLARAHCEVLRSDVAHIRLNGYSLIRTDPYEGEGELQPHTNPTNIHIDNAFLPQHDAATPRELYSRSIVYLNEVAEGGAPIVVWPKAHKAAAEVVSRLVLEEGDEQYHGVRWRDEVISAMTQRPSTADNSSAAYDTRQVSWPGVGPATEVLMGEGDMVIFEPMSMHSASRCVNGVSRYCWVSSFFDDRVAAMPHKLYQDAFHPDFLDKLAPEMSPIVDWLPGYVSKYGSQVLGPETQFWAYNARTTTGVQLHERKIHRESSSLPARQLEDVKKARASLAKQAELYAAARRQQQQPKL